MDTWSGAQRAFAIKAFYKNNDSVEAARREFRRHYNLKRHDRVPSAHAINTWIHSFEETGSAMKKKPPGRTRTVRTPENIESVRAAVIRSPHRSVRRHAVSLQLHSSSVRRILVEDLQYHPYKLQIVQELKPNDHLMRRQFCERILEKINEDDEFVNNLWMSDEAHFHLNGFVNKQNFRYWAEGNPTQLHQRPLHSKKVTVWCAMSSYGLIGPYFFENEDGVATTVTSDRYVTMLETFVAQELQAFPLITENAWFQQDGSTSHTARISMTAVRRLFGNRIISRNGDIPWPPRSPDLSACDFFLWGHLKSKVYSSRPATTEELKAKIREVIAGIPIETLRRTMHNFSNRLQECLRRNGAHLQDVIFKT